VPGDQVRVEVEPIGRLGGLHRFSAKASVDGSTAAEAELVLAVSGDGRQDDF
jgi:3-hydroxymyristoyl/3-hydroxydecanoyl-(acyl carrier protein) dehydratase